MAGGQRQSARRHDRLTSLTWALRAAPIAMAAMLLSPFAQSQVEPPPAASVSDALVVALIQDLGANDFHTREKATTALTEIALTMEELAKRAPTGAFNPEQWVRFERILEDHFLKEPRAALGVEFRPSPDGKGILITNVIKTFPAATSLRNGDVITVVDGVGLLQPANLRGQSVISTQELQRSILSRDPGQKLPMSLVRVGRPIRLDVRLGSYADLPSAVRPDPRVLTRAWQARWERLRLAAPLAPVVKPLKSAGVWPLLPRYDALYAGVGFAPGGQPRANVLDTFNRWSRPISDDAFRSKTRYVALPKAPRISPNTTLDQGMQLRILEAIRELKARAEAFDRMAADMRHSPLERQEASRQSRIAMSQIRSLIQQLENLAGARP